MVCLQETKMKKVNNSVITEIGGGRWADWEHLGAEGYAGGVLVMWDKRRLSKLDSFLGISSVSCLLKLVENDKVWLFSGIYGPCADGERWNMWGELRDIKSRWDIPWCIGGDFNVVRFPQERSGSRVFSRAMAEFNDFINERELVDLPLVGGDYTWFRNNDSHQCSRIDRFLISVDWEDIFGGPVQSCLPRVTSDHVPLLLECGGFNKGKSPFRFENM